MDSPIHIKGELTTSVLRKIGMEIEQRLGQSPEKITLEIDSQGGSAKGSQTIFERFIKNEERIICRILEANSAAALLALLGNRRSISQGGSFGIHLGSISVESNELLEQGKASDRSVKRILAFRAFYLAVLKQRTRLPEEAYAKLHASNRLVLNPDECLKYGIVQEISTDTIAA